MRVHQILLKPGYAETGAITELSITHQDGFDTVTDMLRMFMKDFYSSYLEVNEGYLTSEHCGKSYSSFAKFCSTCGNPLVPVVTSESLHNVLNAFYYGDNNHCGEMSPSMSDQGWEFGYELCYANHIAIVQAYALEILVSCVFPDVDTVTIQDIKQYTDCSKGITI